MALKLTPTEQKIIRALRVGREYYAPRHETLLALLVKGYCTYKEIAAEMGITDTTTKQYICQIGARLRVQGYDVGRLAEIVSYACARHYNSLDNWRKLKT